MTRHLSIPAALLLCLILATAAPASDRDLELAGNWFSSRVEWRTSIGLPIDTEFSRPLVAEYNWAYGSTILGINNREFNSRRYYVAIAGYKDQRLDIYDSIGPMPQAAQLSSGPYHISAGLPDGRIICWLTLPGEFPIQLRLAERYLPGSGFDVIVEPPQPISSNLADWTVLVCYQANVAGNSVATEVLDGEGRLIYDLPGLEMEGVVRQLEYTRHPVHGVDMPWLLASVEYGDSAAGGVLRKAVGSAWYVPNDQWFKQAIRTTGRNNTSIYLDDDAAGGAVALMAWDGSDDNRNEGYIERLHMRVGNSRQIITDRGLPVLFNRYTATHNWCFKRTSANRYPYVLFSDGTDLLFGYNASRRGDEGEDVGYKTFVLQEGQQITDDYGNSGPLYPIEGVAMSTHWSSGSPHVFYIQNGSIDHEGGQLFQLEYTRPGAAREEAAQD